ncbi:hypothetical protein [Carnobacterium divergens]|uniref:hypothetical protein n=1 Tax=Carnobacterium divergens TaxID=2748 RepID=UPI0039AFC208
MKKSILFITIIASLLLISACSNSKNKVTSTKRENDEVSSSIDTEASSTKEMLYEKQKKVKRLQIYNKILAKYNDQSNDIHKLSQLPFSDDTLHKNGVRLSTVQYGKTDSIIIAFDEEGIQAFLLKNTTDLEFVEISLSNLLDSEVTIKNQEIIGTEKFVRGDDYPNDTSEYYIPIVTEGINYYPENANENWQNDFLDVTTESSVNNITDNE